MQPLTKLCLLMQACDQLEGVWLANSHQGTMWTRNSQGTQKARESLPSILNHGLPEDRDWDSPISAAPGWGTGQGRYQETGEPESN